MENCTNSLQGLTHFKTRMSVGVEFVKILREELLKQTATLRKDLERIEAEIKGDKKAVWSRLQSVGTRLDSVESEILKAEKKARKNNLIIVGLEVDFGNIVESTIAKLNQILNLSLSKLSINNIYSLGRSSLALIKVEFTSFLAKSLVLKNRSKLRGTKIYIREDLCDKDRRDEKILRSHLREARKKEYKAYLKNGFLYVNGTKYGPE